MKINKIILSILILGILSACKDNREQFMEDFSTILYITKSGEQSITLYKSGEPTKYNMGIYKSGVKSQTTAVAEVSVLNDNFLNVYNTQNGTSLKCLPENCYKISNKSVTFSAESNNEYVEIIFDTDLIAELPKLNDGEQYALPIQLYSESKINEEKNFVIFKTTVEKATVGFVNNDTENISIEVGGDNIIETQPFSVATSFPNSWDITFEISNSPKYADEYNSANGTNYDLLSPNLYTLEPAETKLPIGTQTITYKYKIDKSNLQFGRYILPVVLTNLSKFELDSNKSVKYIIISYIAPVIDKTNWEVHDYRDYQDGDGDGPGALIDGNINTYWHANWGQGSLLPSWVTIKLNDDKKVAVISQVDLYARQNNTSGPKVVEILTSMDGTNFHLFGKIDFKSTPNCQSVISEKPVKAKYVKMNITEKNNNSVAMGEMVVRGLLE